MGKGGPLLKAVSPNTHKKWEILVISVFQKHRAQVKCDIMAG